MVNLSSMPLIHNSLFLGNYSDCTDGQTEAQMHQGLCSQSRRSGTYWEIALY